jgi:hypothetical protein
VRGLDPADRTGVELTEALLVALVLIDDADAVRTLNRRPDGRTLLVKVAELQLDSLDLIGLSFSRPVGSS